MIRYRIAKVNMNNQEKLKKLQTFTNDPQFAIFDELQTLNDNIKVLIDLENEPEATSFSVDNLSDAKTDLTPLERNFEALQGSVEQITKAIQSIPEGNEIDMSGVEKLLKKIAEKPTDKDNTVALDNLLYAVQTLASKSEEPIEVSIKFV